MKFDTSSNTSQISHCPLPSRWLPDASQMTLRCLPDVPNVSQMPPRCRCLPDVFQFPPSPGGVADSLPPGAQTKKLFCLSCDLKIWPPKVEPKVSKWSSQLIKNRATIYKMLVLELVLTHARKHNEKLCLWIFKNSGFALEGLHFSRFPASSKSWENYPRKYEKTLPQFVKKCFGGFSKT